MFEALEILLLDGWGIVDLMHLKMIDMAAETSLDLDSCETKTNGENNKRQNQLNMLSLVKHLICSYLCFLSVSDC